MNKRSLIPAVVLLFVSVAYALTGNWSTDYSAETSPDDDDILLLQKDPYTGGTQRHATFADVRDQVLATGGNIVLSGQSLTGSQATSLLDASATWNTSGTPTLIKANVTDTASDANSLLMDLQVGGTSKLKISKNGVITGSGNSTVSIGTDIVLTNPNATRPIELRAYVNTTSGLGIEQSNGATLYTADLLLRRDAAGIHAWRNGADPQEGRFFDSYTNNSNGDFASVGWRNNAHVFTIDLEHTGSYTTQRNMAMLTTGGNLGVGTASPSKTLDVVFPDDTNGSGANFRNSDGSISLVNLTGTANSFIPAVRGQTLTGNTSAPGLYLDSDIATDSGSTGATVFRTTKSGSTAAVATRPTFSFKNYTTDQLTILANGNTGIGSSVTSPTTKLHVDGCVRMKVWTVATLPAASTAGAGAEGYISDGDTAWGSTTRGGTVTGGGANFCPVVSDGTNWLYR